MKLIRNIQVYNPKDLGIKDVLIGNDKIIKIDDNITDYFEETLVLDGTNKILIPGFIDNHIHITGGGGEGSFRTRVPEIPLSTIINSGITTVVGLLGTDTSTRNIEALLAKTKALKEEGITAYCLTGGYSYPSKTLTGSIEKDIVFIEEVLGVKLALSDHRSSNISLEELARVASEARVAGMLSGKPGHVSIHMGNGMKGLEPILRLIESSDIPRSILRPTHVNRSEKLLKDAFDFAKMGGIIDLTSGVSEDLSPAESIKIARKLNVPLENITISSDGFGSWSNYDRNGKLLEIGISPVNIFIKELKALVELGFSIDEALQFMTVNVAKHLNLFPKKGNISKGADADLLVVDEDLNLEYVIALGNFMMVDSEVIRRGTYE